MSAILTEVVKRIAAEKKTQSEALSNWSKWSKS